MPPLQHAATQRTQDRAGQAHSGTGKRLYQFTAIDDCTRIRVLKVYGCVQSAHCDPVPR